MVEGKCLVCRNELNRGKKFCGFPCYGQYKKENKILPPSRTGSSLTIEHREILRKSSTGRLHSKESKEKIGNFHRGKIHPERRGENHPRWTGSAIRNADKRIRDSIEYTEWRTAVFKRDNYTCQSCSAKSGNGKAVFLEADHIKPFSIFMELRFDVSNGRTLCKKCHRKTDTYGSKTLKIKRLIYGK